MNGTNYLNCSESDDTGIKMLDNEADMFYNYLYGNLEGKPALYTSLFLRMIVGPALIIGIILYENLGGDRQKRTIMNRLLSWMLTNLALFSILNGVLRIVRDCYGLIPFDIMLWCNFALTFLKVNLVVFYNVLSIVRYLYIVVWKRIKVIDDDFWCVLSVLSTIFVSAALSGYFFMSEVDPNTSFSIKMATHNTTRDPILNSG